MDKTKALSFQKARDSNRCYKQRKSFRVVDKTKEDVKQSAVDNRFKVNFVVLLFILLLSSEFVLDFDVFR